MPITQVNTGQLADGSAIQRTDLCTNQAGKSVIAKVIQGTAIKITATGADAGTGDATISLDTTVDLALAASQNITTTDASTNSVVNVMTLNHNSGGTPTIGFGVGIAFAAEDDTSISQSQGSIQCTWSTVTHASRTAYMDFLLENAGGLGPASKMRLSGVGGLSVNSTVDPGAGVINANTGFRIGNAATSGNIMVGNGSNFVAAAVSGSGATISLSSSGVLTISAIANASLANSAITIAGTSTSLGGSITQDTITGLSTTGLVKRTGANTLAIATAKTDYWDTTDFVASGGSHAHGLVPDPGATAGTTRTLCENATWVTRKGLYNATAATSQTITTADTYLTGSLITINAGDVVAGMVYHALIYVSKGAAGTASTVLNFRGGTGGTTSDASLSGAISPGAQTAVADTGLIEFYATFGSPGASCIITYVVLLTHNTANGLFPSAAGTFITGTLTQPASFNSTAITKFGLSFNGANATNYTVSVLKAELLRP